MEKKFRGVLEHNSIRGNAKKSYIYFKELLEVTSAVDSEDRFVVYNIYYIQIL